jgi:hypothetical protein
MREYVQLLQYSHRYVCPIKAILQLRYNIVLQHKDSINYLPISSNECYLHDAIVDHATPPPYPSIVVPCVCGTFLVILRLVCFPNDDILTILVVVKNIMSSPPPKNGQQQQ